MGNSGREDAKEPAAPFLALRRISKAFGDVAANVDVSLDVYRGEVLGLLGENGAGKTTLMDIVAGVMRPDQGEIYVSGQKVSLRAPVDAWGHGIGMVHQHFMLVPTMTVAENMALGRHRGRGVGRSLGRIRAEIADASRSYGLGIDPEAVVQDLPLSTRQRVEIMRLLVRGAELLIFDEPTSVLAPREIQGLMDILRALAAEGKAVIFITHKLDELSAVCTRCTVLRDGRVVATVNVADTDKASLARLMVGRDVVFRVTRAVVQRGAPVLTVRDLGVELGPGRTLDCAALEICEGEVVGIAGVDGNGQDELIAALMGEGRVISGEIAVRGVTVTHLSPREFMVLGGAIVPSDRHRDAVALDLTLVDNVMMVEFRERAFARHGLVRRKAVQVRVDGLLRAYGVAVRDRSTLMRHLSGGNQQKVVLARELGRNPKLLLAVQPTRGLDVAAVASVYERLNEHKRAGGATLLISSELEEVLSLSDRIAVMTRGRLTKVVDAGDATIEWLGMAMAGG